MIQRYRCGGARSFREVCESWGLVQRAYEKEGYAAHTASGMRFSLRDFYSSTKLFVTYELRRLVCTFSVVDDDEIPLPSAAAFPDEIRKLKALGGRILEGTKFASLEDTYESQRSVLMTLAQLFAWAYFKGAERLIITVNPRHVGFWKRKFGFEPIASTESYPLVQSAPGVLMCAMVKQHIMRCGGHVELTDRHLENESLFSATRIAQLMTSDLQVFERADHAEKWALLRRYPELHSIVPFFGHEISSVPTIDIEQTMLRGSGVRDMLADVFTGLEFRLQHQNIEFTSSTRDFPLKFELRDPLFFLVALQTLTDSFLEHTPGGARLSATARLASNGRDGGIFILMREDTKGIRRSPERELLRRSTPTTAATDKVLRACRLLSKIGAYFTVETERDVRYFALLAPLASLGESKTQFSRNALDQALSSMVRMTDTPVVQ